MKRQDGSQGRPMTTIRPVAFDERRWLGALRMRGTSGRWGRCTASSFDGRAKSLVAMQAICPIAASRSYFNFSLRPILKRASFTTCSPAPLHRDASLCAVAASPEHLDAVLSTRAILVRRSSTMFHTKDPEIAGVISRGDAWITGLACENWLRLVGDEFLD